MRHFFKLWELRLEQHIGDHRRRIQGAFGEVSRLDRWQTGSHTWGEQKAGGRGPGLLAPAVPGSWGHISQAFEV